MPFRFPRILVQTPSLTAPRTLSKLRQLSCVRGKSRDSIRSVPWLRPSFNQHSFVLFLVFSCIFQPFQPSPVTQTVFARGLRASKMWIVVCFAWRIQIYADGEVAFNLKSVYIHTSSNVVFGGLPRDVWSDPQYGCANHDSNHCGSHHEILQSVCIVLWFPLFAMVSLKCPTFWGRTRLAKFVFQILLIIFKSCKVGTAFRGQHSAVSPTGICRPCLFLWRPMVSNPQINSTWSYFQSRTRRHV